MNRYNLVCILILFFVIVVDVDAAKKRFVPSALQLNPSSTGLTVLGVNYPSIQDKFDPVTGLGINNSGISTLGLVDKSLSDDDILLNTDIDLSALYGSKQMVGLALPYPNPMKYADGTGQIYYFLSDDMEMEFRLYDGTSSMIYHTFYDAGSTGGKQGKNYIPFTRNELGIDLSAGLYFYMVLHEGEILGKGKLAVIP